MFWVSMVSVFSCMFCEFAFKEFLSLGQQTTGNKQILNVIKTRPLILVPSDPQPMFTKRQNS